MLTILIIDFSILEFDKDESLMKLTARSHHTLTFRCIYKPTCYMIGFILSSANNQQSVNMN